MMSLARPSAGPNQTSSRVTCISEQLGIIFYDIRSQFFYYATEKKNSISYVPMTKKFDRDQEKVKGNSKMTFAR